MPFGSGIFPVISRVAYSQRRYSCRHFKCGRRCNMHFAIALIDGAWIGGSRTDIQRQQAGASAVVQSTDKGNRPRPATIPRVPDELWAKLRPIIDERDPQTLGRKRIDPRAALD